MLNHFKRFLKAFLIYGIGGFLNRFINFLLLPIFTQYLTPSDYGITSLLALLSMLLGNIFCLGLGTSMGVTYYDKAFKKEDVVSSALGILLLANILAVCIGFLCIDGICYLLFTEFKYQYFTLISIITAALGNIGTVFSLYLRFEEKAKAYTILTNINVIITMTLSIYMVVFLKQGVKGYLEAYFIAQFIFFIVLFLFVSKDLKFKYSWNSNAAKKLIRDGLPQMPTFISDFVMLQTGRLFLQYYYGLEEVGLFSIGHNFGMVIMLFVTAFSTTWIPFAYTFMDNWDEARLVFQKIGTYYFIVFGLLTTGVFVLAKSVVEIMTESQFHSSYHVVGICALAYFFIGLYHIVSMESFLAKDIVNIPIVKFIAMLIFTPINFVCIYIWGFIGTGISLALGQLFIVILQQYYNKLRSEKFISINYEYKKIQPFIFLFSIFIFSSFMIYTGSTYTDLFISLIASLALVSLTFLLVSNDDKQKIIQFILKRKFEV